MIYTLFLDGVCGSFHHKSLLLKLIQTCCEFLIAGFVILDCVEYLRAGFAVAGMGELMCQLFEFVGVRNIVTDHVAHQSNQLIARRTESLAEEKAAVERAVGAQINVNTYVVDITDSAALTKTLDSADAAFGKPECIFFNAARVLPSAFFEHDVKDIEYDFKVRGRAPYMPPISFPMPPHDRLG